MLSVCLSVCEIVRERSLNVNLYCIGIGNLIVVAF